MGDQNTTLTDADIRHLLRRTGFGPTPKDLKKAKLSGANRGQGADYVLGFKPKGFRPSGADDEDVHNKWFKWLLKGKSQFQSKLALFWSDHFATTGTVVAYPKQMGNQIRKHYLFGTGNFKDYVKAMNKDIAMMIFLNTNDNSKEDPNENYARELLELFTLGVTDKNGTANYEQEDIVQIARAFTGWHGDPYGNDSHLHEYDHDYEADYPLRGPKAIFDNAHGFPPGGQSFTTSGEGEAEIDVVTDIIFDHLDSDGMNTVARRTAYRLFEFLTHGEVDWADVDGAIATTGFDSNWDLKALIREILVTDAFYATAEPQPWSATTKKSVKWPIDFAVTTLRLLNLKPKGRGLEIPSGTYREAVEHMRNMGQEISQPPSVFGWDWEAAWLSSATLIARYTFVRDLISWRYGGGLKVKKLIDLNLTDPGEIVDAVTDVFDVTSQITAAERTALIEYVTDNGTIPTLNLRDTDVVNLKIHSLIMLVLQSPAYQLH